MQGKSALASNAETLHAANIVAAINSSSAAASSPIAASWRRSAINYGLNPNDTRKQDLLLASELRQEREKSEVFINAARPILIDLLNSVGQSGCCVALTDAKGTILECFSPIADSETFENARLTVGANWSEEIEGTNGIGTCLAEERAVTIFRDEHFYCRNTEISCMDAPVRDHTGRLIGAIDVSSARNDLNQPTTNLIASIVKDASYKIEARLFRNVFPRSRIINAQNDTTHAPTLLAVDSDDLIIGATRAARRLFGLDDKMINQKLPAIDIFGQSDPSDEFVQTEKSILRRALARSNGSVAEAARSLGIGRATFYRRMHRCQLQ